MNKEESLFSFMSTVWKFDENNSFDKRKELIQALKLNVKTLMEYASVCRSIPEDSIHVISFCELVHECLRIGLRTSPFLFNHNTTTYSLLHKISNHCESALKVINTFEKHCNNNNNNSCPYDHHHQHPQQQQQQQRSLPSPPPPPPPHQQTWSNMSMKNEKKLNFPKFFHSLDSNKIKNYNDNNDKVIKRRTFCSKLSYNSKIAWIHFALIEKLLKTIVQHICSELKECYSSDSIVANECDMNVFLSLISGPCTIHYSSSIHDDSYWYNLHANELVERQRFNLITNHNHIIGRTLQTCAKMKSFLMLPENSETVNDKNEKLKKIRNPSSLLQSSFTNINVDSLYQTRKSTLLYGKNNVMLGDNHNSLGYLELINSTHNLSLRWTSNNLLLQASDVQFYDYHDHDRNVDQCLLNISMNELDNHKVSDKHRRLQYSLSFKNDNVDDYQLGVITVSMNKVEYVHLHQDTTQEYGLILIDLDGIAHPPIRLQGGFNAVYNFLMCLDQGLQPNACLNPSPNSLIESLEDNKTQDNESNEKQQISIKFWNFIDFPNKLNELKENYKQSNNIEPLNEISYHGNDKDEKMINSKNCKTHEVIFKIQHMEISINKNDECILEYNSKQIPMESFNIPDNDDVFKPTETCNQHEDHLCQKEELLDSMDIIDAIKLQLVSRTFNAWLVYTRHMKNIRELLSPLVIHSNRNGSNSFDQYEKLTKAKWNELFLDIPDKQNFDPYCIYECIYYGGCAAELRTEVWPYLLGVYDWKMTNEEKNIINKQLKLHYQEKLQEWIKLEKIIHNIEENETIITSSLSQVDTEKMIENSSSTLLEYNENIIKQFSHVLDSVKKDVVRCDRNNCFYSKFDSHGDRNLATIQRILLTYVWEFLDDEYTQGMCDIVAPLLVLQLDNSITSLNSSHSNNSIVSIMNEQTINYSEEMLLNIEIETYILFKQIMKNRLKKLFAKETATFYMDQKFDHIKSLIQILDPQLISHLQKFSDFTHFYFCYRWFLLDFKREFTYEDVFQIWEVILCAEHVISNDFSLFIALALIQNYRDVISSNHMEFTDILKFFNERAEHHNVEQILNLARYFADTVQKLTSKTNET